NVQALRLADVRTAVGRHVDDHLLRDLPHRLIDVLDVLWDLGNILYGTVCGDQLLPHVLIPQAEFHQVFHQVTVHDDEVAGEGSPRIDIRCVWLKAFVVAENLRGGSRRHGRDQERVPYAVLFHVAFELLPVPASALRGDTPHVELEYALGYRRSLEGFVRAGNFGQLHGCLHGTVVYRFENVFVQAPGFLGVEWHAELDERIRQTLNADAAGAVPHVRPPGLFDGVVVDVDNLVKVARHSLRDLVKLLVIEGAFVGHELRQGNGSQVAHRHFVGCRVLHDLRAEVAR